MHRGANRDGSVADHGQVHTGRDRALKFWDLAADLADDFDHVGAGLPLDIDDDRGRALVPAAVAVVLQTIDDDRDVADGDRRAVAVGDDDGLVGVGGGNLIVGGDGVGLLRAIQRSLGAGDVGAGDRAAQILHRDAIGGQPRQVGLNPPSTATRPTPEIWLRRWPRMVSARSLMARSEIVSDVSASVRTGASAGLTLA